MFVNEPLERRRLLAASVAPTAMELAPVSDTGVANADAITNLNNARNSAKLTFYVVGTTAGAAVRVYADGTLIGSATGTDGFTSVVTNGRTTLADGTRTITARQQLSGDTESADSHALAVTIDTVLPATPPAPDLLASSDSGISGTDNLTSDDTPEFAVTSAEPYVRLFRGGTLVSGMYETGGTIGPLAAQPDGAASYSVAAVDAAGNVSHVSLALSVTVDTKPYVPAGAPAAGTWDTSFGGTGRVITTSDGGDHVNAIVAQPDGKFVAVGDVGIVDSDFPGVPVSDIGLARYNANGTLDTTFGTGGRVRTSLLLFDHVSSAVLQSDGKIVVGGWTREGNTAEDWFLVRYNTDGSIDTTFGGGDGYTIDQFGYGRSELISMVLLPGDKILASGLAFTLLPSGAGANVTALGRFNANGTLDATFGNGGKVMANTVPTSSNGIAGAEWDASLALQPDGKIVTTSFGDDPSGAGRFIVNVARMHPDGSLDLSFGGDGSVQYPVGPDSENHSAIAVHPDGRIIVGGTYFHAQGTSEAFMMAVNPDGSLDTTFGDGGVRLDPLSDTAIHAGFTKLLIESNGRIIGLGHVIADVAYGQFAVARYLPNGSRDTTFGADGVNYTDLSFGANGINAGQLLIGGKLLVGGSAWSGFNDRTSDFAVGRYHLDPAPPAPDLQSSSDTGAGSGDDVTADATPSFTVPAAPSGHFLRVYRDNVLVGDYASGTSFTPVGQPDGTWKYSLGFVDAAGNEAARSAPLVVTIDTAGAVPAIAAIAPSPRSTPLSSITITFDAPVTGGFDLSDVVLTRDGVAIPFTAAQTLTSSDGVTWTLGGITAITDKLGTYDVSVGSNAIIDLAGNGSSAAANGWKVNTFVGTNSDWFHLVRNAADAALVDFTYGSGSGYSVDLARLGQLRLLAFEHNDTLQIDLSRGPLVAPHGILYDAGTSDPNFSWADRVSVIGSAGDDVVTFAPGAATIGGVAVTSVGNEGFLFHGGAGNDTLNVNSGTFTFDSDAFPQTQNLTLNVAANATVQFNARQHLAALHLSPNSVARMQPALGSRFLHTKALSIAPGAKVDLANNDLLWDYTGDTPYAAMKSYVITGRNTGTGGILTTATGDTVMAVVDNVLLNRTTWLGTTIDDTTVIGRYTYFGDANLDGKVTGDDYLNVDANLGLSGAQWFHGDFNFDGTVTGDDYLAIDAHLGKGTTNPLSYGEDQQAMSELHAEQYGGASYVKAVEQAAKGKYTIGGAKKGEWK